MGLEGDAMQCNLGHTDRVLRMTIGLTLIGLAAFGITSAWAWFGVIPFATGAIGYCPAYKLLGISTKKK